LVVHPRARAGTTCRGTPQP